MLRIKHKGQTTFYGFVRGCSPRRKIRKGQTTIEFVTVLIIVIGALVAMSNYMKRGIQGRWKASVDAMGDQYDPRFGDTSMRHLLASNTATSIVTVNNATGYWTTRVDVTNSLEQKTGYEGVDGY